MSITKLLAGLCMVSAAALVAAPSTQAFPPSGSPSIVSPGPLNGNGQNSTAIFVFTAAANESVLNLAGNPIFDNTVNASGDTFNLGALLGPQVFELLNVTQGPPPFQTTSPGVDGFFHAFYTQNYADFGVGALPPLAATAIAGLAGNPVITFIGWEDKTKGQGSDFDYNDLIFAFSNLTTQTTGVPEPSTWLLLATGFAGVLGYGWRKRRTA